MNKLGYMKQGQPIKAGSAKATWMSGKKPSTQPKPAHKAGTSGKGSMGGKGFSKIQ